MSSIYLSNAIFMMIILTIIFLRIRYYITWSPSKKYTMIFIGMVELYVLMDALFMKELLGKSGNLLQFKMVVFFFYLVYVIMPKQIICIFCSSLFRTSIRYRRVHTQSKYIICVCFFI